MAPKKVKDLKANPKNPRTISDEKLAMLGKSLVEFGDLSGIVFNVESEMLVGGHQRAKLIPPGTEVVIERKFKKPTKVGTIAEGYIILNGERMAYREVSWDEVKEKAANIAANKGAGDWDISTLSEWMRDIDSFGFDLDLTGFTQTEREDLMVPTVNPNFEPGTEGDQAKLDEKKPMVCPHCGEEFTVGGRV